MFAVTTVFTWCAVHGSVATSKYCNVLLHPPCSLSVYCCYVSAPIAMQSIIIAPFTVVCPLVSYNVLFHPLLLPLQCFSSRCNSIATRFPLPALPSPIAMQVGLPFQHFHPPLQRKSVSYSNALLSHCNASRSPLLALPSPIATQVGLLLRHSCNATRSPAPTLSRPIAMQVGLPFQYSHPPLQCNSVSCSNALLPHCNASRSPAATLLQCHSVSCSNALPPHCNASQSPLPVFPSPIATQLSLLLQRSPAPLQCNSASCSNTLLPHSATPLLDDLYAASIHSLYDISR